MLIRKSTLLILLTATSISLTSCNRQSSTVANGAVPVDKLENLEQISVMTYNIENLFDNQHDADTNDYARMSKEWKDANPDIMNQTCSKLTGYYKTECFELDWSDKVISVKLKNVANAIKQVNKGKGPDVLVLEEVENLNVLKMLNAELGSDANYQTVELLEGFDKRGIDIGILSKFPLFAPAKIHKIKFTSGGLNTRGIMEVPLILPNQSVLHVFGLHFPSQSNPVKFRVDAVNTLISLMKAVPKGHLSIAGGDFNITKEEGLFETKLSEDFSVSHLIGCKLDTGDACPGTHAYNKNWDFLDALVFPKEIELGKSEMTLVPDSITTPNAADQQTRDVKNNKTGKIEKHPNRFDAVKLSGVADHLPILARFKLSAKPATQP